MVLEFYPPKFHEMTRKQVKKKKGGGGKRVLKLHVLAVHKFGIIKKTLSLTLY